MATIKAVKRSGNLKKATDYITRDEKTDSRITGGYNCNPETAYDEMKATKSAWGKEDGRQYKQYVQSFAPGEVTPEKAFEIAQEFVENCKQFEGFEVLYATHQDREHIHTHFILNSVSFEDGHKYQQTPKQLQEMKDLSDSIVLRHGLKICEKGRTQQGEDREQTTGSRELLEVVKKAESGELESWAYNIALAVFEEKHTATSREEFIKSLDEKGIETDWQDSHKYITFTDKTRQEQGEKKCKLRNKRIMEHYNIDLSKEGLENEFKGNREEISYGHRADREHEEQSRDIQIQFKYIQEHQQRPKEDNRGTGQGIGEPTAEEQGTGEQAIFEKLERKRLEKRIELLENVCGKGEQPGHTATYKPTAEQQRTERTIEEVTSRIGLLENVGGKGEEHQNTRATTADAKQQSGQTIDSLTSKARAIGADQQRLTSKARAIGADQQDIAGKQQEIGGKQHGNSGHLQSVISRIGTALDNVRDTITETLSRPKRGR